jgi:mannose-6-phosphate isomerase-like protein (cupin superfamily)
MDYTPINLADKFTHIDELWAPRIIARLNDYHLKLARIQGEFVWHSHAETDELFLVVQGQLRLDFRDGQVELAAGELFVVPRGVEHRPFAAEDCQILLIEPAGTANTGDAGGDRTQSAEVWV